MSIIRSVIVFFLLITSLNAQFLVKDQEYRCPPSDTSCKSPHNLSSLELRSLPNAPQRRFSVNYIEFKDNGELWNPIELTDAVNQIKKARKGGQKPLVMVYVHGWQNNADETKTDDVSKFRDTLMARLAELYPAGSVANSPQVVGIYLAWRGLTFTVEPFKHVVSYWPRRAVARHEGQTGMRNALEQIERAVYEHRQDYFLVFAGHSFGARVLENAAEDRNLKHPGFMTTYRSNLKLSLPKAEDATPLLSEEERANNTNLPADLFFYVNAATASTVTRQTISDIKKTCEKNPSAAICSADPLYLAVTSHADLATGIIMPIANFVFPAITSDHLHLVSAANTSSLHTHADPQEGCSATSGLCFKIEQAVGAAKKYSVDRIPGRTQIPGKSTAPFWIFNVDKNVMKSHDDVWNATVTDMVADVILRNRRFNLLAVSAVQKVP